jgi:hypothetical protein
MELTSREKAWKNRKVYKESNPTYARYNKYAKTLKERMENINIPDAWSEEGIAEREEFAKKFGRAWYIFQGKEMRYNRPKTWIEQYHIEDPRRPRGKGLRSKSV